MLTLPPLSVLELVLHELDPALFRTSSAAHGDAWGLMQGCMFKVHHELLRGCPWRREWPGCGLGFHISPYSEMLAARLLALTAQYY